MSVLFFINGCTQPHHANQDTIHNNSIAKEQKNDKITIIEVPSKSNDERMAEISLPITTHKVYLRLMLPNNYPIPAQSMWYAIENTHLQGDFVSGEAHSHIIKNQPTQVLVGGHWQTSDSVQLHALVFPSEKQVTINIKSTIQYFVLSQILDAVPHWQDKNWLNLKESMMQLPQVQSFVGFYQQRITKNPNYYGKLALHPTQNKEFKKIRHDAVVAVSNLVFEMEQKRQAAVIARKGIKHMPIEN